MAKEKKKLSEKEMASKLKELKIELLKQPQKKKAIKKEIARLLTMARNSVPSTRGTKVPSSSGAKQIQPTKLEGNAK